MLETLIDLLGNKYIYFTCLILFKISSLEQIIHLKENFLSSVFCLVFSVTISRQDNEIHYLFIKGYLV